VGTSLINIHSKLPSYERISVSDPASSGRKIPILMYHGIANVTASEWPNLYVRVAELEAQLEYLHENGYQTITFEDLDNIGAFSKPVMLTFDDGYECNYNILFPLLKKYNFKATIFVVTNAWWSKGRLSREQILEMSNSGLVSIQSHTVNHYSLPSLNAATLKTELESSKLAIEELTGKPVVALCYPSGSNNSAVRAVAAENYKYAVLNYGGKFTCGSNLMSMNRVRISRGMSVKAFASQI
jgi:peptidoglycan/xylan/chitin deacetylase (PgdA/CDA1 family)